jgi:hypothetical protein
MFVIVRTYSAGVFFGNLESRNGREVTLTEARRLWMWRGATCLSQLAVSGTSKPSECKFSVPVPRITVLEAIEVIDCTLEGEQKMKEVPEWKV